MEVYCNGEGELYVTLKAETTLNTAPLSTGCRPAWLSPLRTHDAPQPRSIDVLGVSTTISILLYRPRILGPTPQQRRGRKAEQGNDWGYTMAVGARGKTDRCGHGCNQRQTIRIAFTRSGWWSRVSDPESSIYISQPEEQGVEEIYI